MGMSKFGPIKIAIVLIIAISYLLLFGITERVESVDDDSKASLPHTSAAGEETEPPRETAAVTEQAPVTPSEITFPDYSDLNVSNPLRPFQDNAAVLLPSGYEDILTEAETTVPEATTTTVPDVVIDDVTTTTEAPATEAVTVTAAVTTTAAEPPQTTTATTTAPEQSNPSGETLTIRYSGSGGSVEGDAADILARVVMGEIGGSFDEEAIKAQAVASYTYIKYYNNNGSTPNVAVATPNQRVKNCVNEVLGQGIYFNGELIQAVYCASSAGYTASSKEVWGVDYSYLQSKKCELDALYDPNYGAKTTFTSNEIRRNVRDATGIELEGDPGSWFAIKSHIDNVYVGSLSIGGKTSYTDDDGKQIEITGKVMREKIMNYDIRSSCFEISYNADTDKFTFTTYGYGHGVGMSQNGANNLAKYWDYDYKEILGFYFPGTEIK